MEAKKVGTIIVIEDDLDDQLLMKNAFSSLGYLNKIVFFSDGFKALEHIQLTEVKPFLILSDINMPTVNGFELRT